MIVVIYQCHRLWLLVSSRENYNIILNVAFYLLYNCPILSECTPPTSLHVILDNDQYGFKLYFTRSGFVCHDCPSYKKHSLQYGCTNCSLCPVGTCMYNDENRCLQCPAGNGKKQLFHRWYTYCKRQVTGNHLKHCALKHVYITEEKTFRPYIFSTCSSKCNSVKPLSFKLKKKKRILKKL